MIHKPFRYRYLCRRYNCIRNWWRVTQRELKFKVLWLALLMLLSIYAIIFRYCYAFCLPNQNELSRHDTPFIASVSNQQYRTQLRTVKNSLVVGEEPEAAGAKGPFASWEEANEALRSIRKRDVQLEIGAPLSASFKAMPNHFAHLPGPLPDCDRFYLEDSPVNIDYALIRMMGPNTTVIPTHYVRNVSVALSWTTHYKTRFPLRDSSTVYVLKDGKLYFDRRTNHPRRCGHQHKIVGVLSFLHDAALLGPLPDVAFRYSCLDNPYPPLLGVWTYTTLKEALEGPLAFPDDYFIFERWKKLRPDPSEASYREKPMHAAWVGSRTGDKPLHHANRSGFLKDIHVGDSFNQMTSREYFVQQYGSGQDARLSATFDKIPMSQMLAQNRMVLAIAGHSYASSTLPLLMSNSLLVVQDFPTSSWEDTFFIPGVHFLAIPRNMNDRVVQSVLDLIHDPRNDEYVINMTRLAATVAETVVDPLLSKCYTHRALQVWHARMEAHATQLESLDEEGNNNLVELIDFSSDASSSLSKEQSPPDRRTPKQLLTQVFQTRVYTSGWIRFWETFLIWWWDIDYRAPTYL